MDTIRWGILGCGAIGAAVWDFAGLGPHVDQAEIGGTAGVIRFSVFGDGPVVLVAPDGAEERFVEPPPEHVAGPLIQTVVDALRGVGECPSTGESAARTSRVMDAALAGFRMQMRETTGLSGERG